MSSAIEDVFKNEQLNRERSQERSGGWGGGVAVQVCSRARSKTLHLPRVVFTFSPMAERERGLSPSKVEKARVAIDFLSSLALSPESRSSSSSRESFSKLCCY